MTTPDIAAPNLAISDESLAKELMDLAGSLLLITILAPFFLLAAVMIKFDSEGPVLFRQKRIGKDGDPFYIWKFRSMRADVPPYSRSPASYRDTRLTRVGRILRRLSIDELPQLVNVVKGEMSLVGPRPEMPFIVETYGPLERQRLCVKPGITGLWQISPARAMPIHHNLQYDLFYIRNRTLLLDCAILLRTVTAVVRGVGAA
jgi:lipopolysaccharide/colanic/teichoic acid biosynthesis glycosyltransferase